MTEITLRRVTDPAPIIDRVQKHTVYVSAAPSDKAADSYVFLTQDEYEDLVDSAALAAAIGDTKPADMLPAEHALRLAEGEHPIRVWREHRGLTLRELAGKSGVGRGYISEIETGKKPGSVDALQKIAAALALALDDVITVK